MATQMAAKKSQTRRETKRQSSVRKSRRTLLRTEDPIDKVLLRIHRRKDPLNWVTFNISKTTSKIVRGRRTRSRNNYVITIDRIGEGGLSDFTQRLSEIRLGMGIASVRLNRAHKYALVTYASEDVGGHEIFRIKGLKKKLASRFGSVHADIMARHADELTANAISSVLRKTGSYH